MVISAWLSVLFMSVSSLAHACASRLFADCTRELASSLEKCWYDAKSFNWWHMKNQFEKLINRLWDFDCYSVCNPLSTTTSCFAVCLHINRQCKYPCAQILEIYDSCFQHRTGFECVTIGASAFGILKRVVIFWQRLPRWIQMKSNVGMWLSAILANCGLPFDTHGLCRNEVVNCFQDGRVCTREL